MLVRGLAARVRAITGGPVNYLTYGGGKLVRYELAPELARTIGVPARGGEKVHATETVIREELPPMNLILYGPPGTGKTFALNQVMRAVVSKLSRLSGAPDNQRALRQLSFVYADIADAAPKALRWDRIVPDRTNRRWRGLVSLARLFLSERHQQTSAGSIDGHALLFEMNVLFEEYVGRVLSRALAGTGFRVASQGGHRNCLYEGETGRFRTRPDLMIRQGNDIRLIIDTKWKRMTPQIDDPRQGVSQADIYQLMAYGRLYDCPKVMLLYPHHGDLPAAPIRRRYSIAAKGADETLIVATQDLAGSRRDHEDILRRLVLDCVECAGQSAPDGDQRSVWHRSI